MKIIMSSKNLHMNDYLKEQVEKKVNKLDRYFNPDTEIHVTLTMERSRHKTEVTVPINGVTIRSEVENHDMYNSIDMALDKLEKQMHRHKQKLSRKFKSGAFHHKTPVYSEMIEDSELGRVVRTKSVSLKPMSIEEAIMQMDLLGHSFFVFTNAETELVSVLYKRKDEQYGLIEPD